MSFQQGLSGLNAAAKNLDVIGNNVANANTTGFKQSVASFGDVFAASLGGGGGAQVGIGANLSSVAQQFSQGNITVTNNPLDIAINGRGFFRMSDGGAIGYARDGQFSIDKGGYIVDSAGMNLTGFQEGVLVNLKLPTTDLSPWPTGKVTIGANLPAAAETFFPVPPAAQVAIDPSDSKTFNYSTAISAVDSLGQSHPMTLFFQNVTDKANPGAGITWNVEAFIEVDGVPVGSGPTKLTFDNVGELIPPAPPPAAQEPDKTFDLKNGADVLTLKMDYSLMTQYGSSFGVNALVQDGYSSGGLSGYSIGADGTLVGRYNNGQTQTLGQVALANFSNAQGLTPMGQNKWSESVASGAALVGAPGTASLGSLQSAAREDSNVDLTAELVNMITAQRIYQANAQSIKTQDAIMQTIVNLK